MDAAPEPSSQSDDLVVCYKLYSRFVLAFLFIVCLDFWGTYFLSTTATIDLRHAHGRGAWIIVLLALLPFGVRAVVVWIFGGATFLWTVARFFRISDRRVDFVISADGVTDLGHCWGRHLTYDGIQRVTVETTRSRWFGRLRCDVRFHPRQRQQIKLFGQRPISWSIFARLGQEPGNRLTRGLAWLLRRNALTLCQTESGLGVDEILAVLERHRPGIERAWIDRTV